MTVMFGEILFLILTFSKSLAEAWLKHTRFLFFLLRPNDRSIFIISIVKKKTINIYKNKLFS